MRKVKEKLKLKWVQILVGFLFFNFFFFLIISYQLQKELIKIYEGKESQVFKDRFGKEIFLQPNENSYFSRYLAKVPPRFKELLIKKEDKIFYYHFGFNPWSIIQAGLSYLGIGHRQASSTISQQLVKILLEKELERNLKNKIIESFYTLALEIFQSKEKILKMYINSVYFGHQAQGLAEASRLYFNLPPQLLSDGQILQLLATIESPTEINPAKPENEERALSLARRLNLKTQNLLITKPEEIKENLKRNFQFSDSLFEIQSFINSQSENQLTLDKELNEKIRKIIQRNIEELKPRNVRQAAAIVIKLPENEILALIGSPDPKSPEEGSQINMLNEPRPIGSTIKPFIYLKAFEKGLRPYTLVDDKEYKYITAIGFPLYPKNFDWQYRGRVNLHYALANSLNVPAVKVLEYVGLENFYKFLENDLNFKPVQNLENYQLGIALGALEMSLLDLSHYFTIFANNGILKPLKIFPNQKTKPQKEVAKEQYIQLINKILNDRKTGIEQFGMRSQLNLFQGNYALKTGTSRDFKDSWIIGYTPDFLIGVWVGNADNTPTEGISGQIGAGKIWSEIMELLLNSPYNKKTIFDFHFIEEIKKDDNMEYGLKGDNYQKKLTALVDRENELILSPHDGDVFWLEEKTKIIFKAKENSQWFVNEDFWAEGQEIIFSPQKTGVFKIKAKTSDSEETITIFLVD